jgi:uncharacterized protein YciI
MPVYVMLGRDGPRGVELRKQHRPAHLENLQPLEDAGRIRFAGPLIDPEGLPFGSVVVFDAPSLEDARAVAASDPYVEAGVFVSYEVHETKVVFPAG